MKSTFVKPENIIMDSAFVKRRINNKRFASLVEKNRKKKIAPLVCVKVKRKYYLIDGYERLFNILLLNKTGMKIEKVEVELY